MKTPERILAALREARTQLEASKAEMLEPIAVVGMSCRFPGSGTGVESFWNDLRAGVDAVREITPDRWDIDEYYDPSGDAPGKMYVREAALLDRVDQFDAAFFGISPREAASLDPQQRLLLEVAWEAIENAGIAPGSLTETRTGVFLGIGQNDYARLATAAGRQNDIGAYDGTGNGFCFAAGRLSYVLGLQGPNLAIDTACSSSLVAVHLAVQSLRRGESDCALAAGVQLILSPEATLFLCQTKALAEDGRSKPFDASANGYGRGEGCGVVVLKRLSSTLQSGDRILAIIRGSAVNHDGPSSGLTVPNPHAQETLLRAALGNAGVRPNEIGYIEAHGTGTILGDPLELRALASVFGEGRAKPLLLGSVKANIGHTEAAAGIAGLIKTILMLQHREIPPCVHFHVPNSRVPWGEVPFQIPRAVVEWTDDKRLAGVSSFSLSGTNAHVILEAAPPVEQPTSIDASEVHLLTLSAKTETALREVVARHRDHLQENPEISLGDFCYTASVGRTHLSHRWCAVVGSFEEARLALNNWLSGMDTGTTGVVPASRRQPVLFHAANESWTHWGVDPSDPLTSDGALEIEIDPATADRQTMLGCLAQLYVKGFPIRWDVLYKGSNCRRAALPTYPFERQRYWLEASSDSHPLLERKIQSPLMAEILFEGSVTAHSPAFLTDHRIFDEIVVPGAFHLSGLLGAGQAVLGNVPIELKDIVFPAALVIRKGERHKLQLFLKPETQGGFSFRLISVIGDSWSTHAQGWLGSADSQQRVEVPEPNHALESVEAAGVYEDLARRGIQLGPTFRWIAEARARSGWATCRMRQPAAAGEGYALHPGLLDSCLQLLSAAAADTAGNETFIPFHIERLRYEPSVKNNQLSCSASLRREESTDFRTGDIQLVNGARETILEVRGLEVRVHAKRTDPLYDIQWRKAMSPDSQTAPKGRWLVLADSRGISDGIEKFLKDSGAQCVVVPPTEPLEIRDAHFDGIVHLRSLAIEEAAVAQEIACASVLQLAKALTYPPSNCLLFTQGAHQVAGSAVDPSQSFLWGIQPVLRREHPGWSPVVIDLDPNESVFDWSKIFVQSQLDDQFAIRSGEIWTPRVALCSSLQQTIPIAPQRSYLITGGFGALGLRTAQWLAAKGATHIVLSGHREPRSAALETIAKMRDAGVEVLTIVGDVASHIDVENMIRLVAATLPPLAGVIHAAGSLDDRLLSRCEWSEFRRVLAPKVDGAWNLHRQTRSMPLDFFVCFSSIASLIASPGQGAYAAANAFLDGLMRFRRNAGMPGLSIQWGPWAESGMAEKTKERMSARWESTGVSLLCPDDALRILGSALGYDGAQLAVFDFRRLANRLSPGEVPRILSELIAPKPVSPERSNRRDQLVRQLAESEFAERMALLDEYMRDQVGKALGFRTSLRDTGESLTAMGVDSMMALELRTTIGSELGKDVPLVRFLDGSAIPDLIALLAAQFETAAPTMATTAEEWVEGEL